MGYFFNIGSGIKLNSLCFQGNKYQLSHFLSPWESIWELYNTYVFVCVLYFKKNLEKFHSRSTQTIIYVFN